MQLNLPIYLLIKQIELDILDIEIKDKSKEKLEKNMKSQLFKFIPAILLLGVFSYPVKAIPSNNRFIEQYQLSRASRLKTVRIVQIDILDPQDRGRRAKDEPYLTIVTPGSSLNGGGSRQCPLKLGKIGRGFHRLNPNKYAFDLERNAFIYVELWEKDGRRYDCRNRGGDDLLGTIKITKNSRSGGINIQHKGRRITVLSPGRIAPINITGDGYYYRLHLSFH